MKRRVVVKLGGSAIEQDGVVEQLATDLRNMPSVFPIIVHGGGLEIGRYLELMGKKFTFVNGLRVTGADMIEVVEMVLSGKINKGLVTRFQHCGVNALGVSGKDMRMLQAKKYKKDGVDIGFVGEIIEVNTDLLNICELNSIIPVVSPISGGVNGETYNVNADHAALDIARAMVCEDIVFISDVAGIQRSDGRPVRRLTPELADALIEAGEITGGMIPKVSSALECLSYGVRRARIIAWKEPGTLIKELAMEESTYGTVVTTR